MLRSNLGRKSVFEGWYKRYSVVSDEYWAEQKGQEGFERMSKFK